MSFTASLQSLTRAITNWNSPQPDVELLNPTVEDGYVFVEEIQMIPPALYKKFIEVIDKQIPDQTENQELKLLLEQVKNSSQVKALAQAYININSPKAEVTETSQPDLSNHVSVSAQATPPVENSIETNSHLLTRATDLEKSTPHRNRTGEDIQIEEQKKSQPTQEATKQNTPKSKTKTDTGSEDKLPWCKEDFITSQRYSDNQAIISQLIAQLGKKQLTKTQFRQLILQLNPSHRSWLPRVEFNYYRILLTLSTSDSTQLTEAQFQLLNLAIDCFIFTCGFTNNYSQRRHLIRLMDNELGIPFVPPQPRVVYRCSDYYALVFGNLVRCFISPLAIKQLSTPQLHPHIEGTPVNNVQGKQADVPKPPADATILAASIDGVSFYQSTNGTYILQTEGGGLAPVQLDDLPSNVSPFQLQDACGMIQQGVFSAESFVKVFEFLHGAPLIADPTSDQVMNRSCRGVLKLQPILCLNLRLQTDPKFKQQAHSWVKACNNESELSDCLSMINDPDIRIPIIKKALSLNQGPPNSLISEHIRPNDFQYLSKDNLDKIPLSTQHSGLLKAASSGDLASVKKLVEHGIDLNHVVSGDYTLLHFAAMFGELEVVKYLHQEEPELHRTYSSPTPLCLAAANGNLEVVKYLAEEDPELLYCPKEYPLPIHRACEAKQTKVIEYLINQNPEFLAKSSGFSGSYPLHYLAINGDITSIKAIEQHITVEHLTKKNNLYWAWAGATAKEYAKASGKTECYDYLVQLQHKLTPQKNCAIQ